MVVNLNSGRIHSSQQRLHVTSRNLSLLMDINQFDNVGVLIELR